MRSIVSLVTCDGASDVSASNVWAAASCGGSSPSTFTTTTRWRTHLTPLLAERGDVAEVDTIDAESQKPGSVYMTEAAPPAVSASARPLEQVHSGQ